jgi:ATP-binding cassette subfamily B protein
MKKTRPLYRFILPYLSRYKSKLLAGTVFVVFTTGFQLTAPWILRDGIKYIESDTRLNSTFFFRLLNQGIQLEGPTQILVGYALLIVLVTLLQGIFRFLMRNTLIGVSRTIEYDIRNDYFTHLLRQSQTFYHRHKTGQLMALATNDLEAVRSMLGPGIMYLINTLLVASISLTLMFHINVEMTLWVLLPLPVLALLVNRLVSRIHSTFRRIQEQFSNLTANVQENLSGIRIIKSYVQEEHEIDNFDQQNREYIQRNLEMAKIRASLRSIIESLLGVGIVILIWIGGRKAIAGEVQIGDLVAFLVYFGMLSWPMIALGWVLNIWQQGLASTQRLYSIFQETPDIQDTSQTDPSIKALTGTIEFDSVSFQYSGSTHPNLHQVSFTVPSGSTLAIVGATGSGKSTLINLIPRLFDVTEGQIRIDGHPIESIPKQVLRDHVGYVPQETFLFSDTIKENIAYGVPSISIPEIKEATESSQIRVDLDQFPEGLDTLVGERGITLSGGQKQRTALSRAIIKKPSILLLDDALSAVDTYTEERILDKLGELMKDRTCVISSHRVSTIRHADQIICLRDGKVIERGTHEELLTQKGFYASLYERQQLEQSLEQF